MMPEIHFVGQIIGARNLVEDTSEGASVISSLSIWYDNFLILIPKQEHFVGLKLIMERLGSILVGILWGRLKYLMSEC